MPIYLRLLPTVLVVSFQLVAAYKVVSPPATLVSVSTSLATSLGAGVTVLFFAHSMAWLRSMNYFAMATFSLLVSNTAMVSRW